MPKRLLSLAGLALWLSSAAATADDKDLLKKGAAPPNLLIVFGNSQTTEQPIQGSTSAWDGDGDSAFSKMGAAKKVLRQFISDKHSTLNIGMTAFSHNPNVGSITLRGKHWLYSPLTEDFPNQPWKEPAGTIERWGLHGEGPCSGTLGGPVPDCAKRLPTIAPNPPPPPDPYLKLPSGAVVQGAFFGFPTAPVFICLDVVNNRKPASCTGTQDNSTQRIQVTLTAGKYGDAYTDSSLSASAYTLGDHSMTVTKVYQIKSDSNWVTGTLTGDSATAVVNYVPSSTLTRDLFYTTKPGDITTPCVAGDLDCGKEIGFLNDPQLDVDVNANCSGWEFQKSQTGAGSNPLIRIPHDYKWGAACNPPQDSLPCANRLLRPQAKLVAYNQTSGAFTTTDPDNPGYTGTGSKYADGCDSTLMGAADPSIDLDIAENQAIMITRNGSQAPIKNLLINILNYFNELTVDGFQNGVRPDDPNKACRVSAVILIYDNFNGCQNDSCKALTTAALAQLNQIGVKVFVIGFGKGVGPCADDTCAGFCIAQQTAAFQADGKTVGYFAVSDAAGLFQVLNDIASILDQATQTFATAAVSTSQTLGGQMAYFASFSASKERSIWNGRLGGYKLLNGLVQLAPLTIRDPADPANLKTLQVPSNVSGSLIWNAGANLLQTHGTGATVASDILAPGDTIHTGTYTDASNDVPNTAAPMNYYLGRKIVFSLPQNYPQYASPSTIPLPAADAVPESRFDMTYTKTAPWWPTLRALLAPQSAAPGPPGPVLMDDDAGNSLRFIWGDRDPVTMGTGGQKYCDDTGTSCQKLGDIFHSTPLVVGNPNDFALFKTNTQGPGPLGYQTFFNAYKNRRRVLYVGANDGLLHALDAGVVGRDPAAPADYDLGTGAELFAFAPRAIMQIFKPLKDAKGPQTKQDEWTVDLSPSAADVFIDAGDSVPGRAWHTVLVGGVREGSPFEGTTKQHSQGSYYALDITQPDELVGGVESPGDQNAITSKVPKCLNRTGDPTCARDWPTALWEITDTCDLDASGTTGATFPDMGETWSKAAMGRIKVCASGCDGTSPVTEDHYVAIFGGGFDRQRLNQRGNWLYMVDIETGKTIYKVNSSCGGDPIVSGCTPTYFGSIPSEPTALDYNNDGYLDLIYVGDQKGQLWRIDLTDLRKRLAPPTASTCDPSNRFRNQLELTPADSGKLDAQGLPFLLFQAPQPPPSALTPFYPIYFRPEAISLGYVVGGKPALGIAFGTGDRDDILATVDPSSLGYPQRFYYVVDAANKTKRTEGDLMPIPCATTNSTSTVPLNGWVLQLTTDCTNLTGGERVVGDTLAVGGIIRFPVYSPLSSTPSNLPCANTGKCSGLGGTSRLYQVDYVFGNAYHAPGYPGLQSDRGETQPYAMFITSETAYISGGTDAHGIYYSGGAKNPTLGVGRKITVRSWKEKTSRP